MDAAYSETGIGDNTESENPGKGSSVDTDIFNRESGVNETSGPALHASFSDAESAPITLDEITSAHVESMAGFDPSIHAVDSEGRPRRKKDGSFALKRGRKGGAASPSPAARDADASGRLPPRPAHASDAAPVDYRAIAAAAVGTSLGIAVMTLGDEWRPKDKAEHAGLIDATAAYIEAKGVQDIPPGWLLAAVVSSYALPRLTAPTTKSRLMAGWLRFKAFFSRKKSPVSGAA